MASVVVKGPTRASSFAGFVRVAGRRTRVKVPELGSYRVDRFR